MFSAAQMDSDALLMSVGQLIARGLSLYNQQEGAPDVVQRPRRQSQQDPPSKDAADHTPSADTVDAVHRLVHCCAAGPDDALDVDVRAVDLLRILIRAGASSAALRDFVASHKRSSFPTRHRLCAELSRATNKDAMLVELITSTVMSLNEEWLNMRKCSLKASTRKFPKLLRHLWISRV